MYHPFQGSDYYNKAINDRHDSNKREFKGRGAYAYVDQDKSDHELDNVNRVTSSGNMDGGKVYHQTLFKIQHKINNPFFPKIFSDPGRTDSAIANEYKMEKLYPLTSDKIMSHPSQFQQLLIQLFGQQAAIDEADVPDSMHNRGVLLADWLSEALLHHVEVRDPQLAEALEIIRSIARRNNLHADLHPGNLMWRMTGTRPQLVITDPLQ